MPPPRRLVLHLHPLCRGSGVNLGAVQGQERLVGGDHMLARGNGLQNKGAGRLVAADQLDDDVDLRVVEDVVRTGGEDGRINRHSPVAGDIQVGDAAERDAGAHLVADNGAVVPEQFHHPGPDVAETDQSCLDVVHSGVLRSSSFGQASSSSRMPVHKGGRLLVSIFLAISIAC